MAKLAPEIINQIPVLYKKYGVKKKVAEELGISVSSVSKYLNITEAMPASIEKKPRVKITDEVIAKINELYSEYKNMSKVAKELGIAATTVKKYLNEENLQLQKNTNEDRDALWYYIFRLFGQNSEDKPVSDWNVTQMQKFKAMGMPYRGQLLTLKYFYEVQKHDLKKANGSIGIIPYVYGDAKNYYEKQAQKADEVTRAIRAQLEKDRIEIHYNPDDYIGRKKKNKKKIDLSEIGE